MFRCPGHYVLQHKQTASICCLVLYYHSLFKGSHVAKSNIRDVRMCVSHTKMKKRNIFLKYKSNFPPCSLNISYISSQELNIIHVNGCRWLNKCLLEKYVKISLHASIWKDQNWRVTTLPWGMVLTHYPHSRGSPITAATRWEQGILTGGQWQHQKLSVPARKGKLPFVFLFFVELRWNGRLNM